MNVRVNDGSMGRVKVNFINPDFTYGSYTGRYYTDFTQDLTAIPYDGYKFVRWTSSEGTYLSTSTDETTVVTLSPNGSLVTAIFAPDDETEGTEFNPIIISTASDLVAMSDNVNAGLTDSCYYELANDIDMNGVSFNSIGISGAKFKGSFDGKGHVIRNITINNTVQAQGLFGYATATATIKNVGVENITVNGGKNVGGIVGNNKGLVKNCYSTGALTGDSTVGGIAGNNVSGTIENCFSTATVNGAATSTSGIAGKVEVDGFVNNSYSLVTPVVKIEGTVDSLTKIVTTDEMKNGTVMALLNAGENVWVQGANHPVFTGNAFVSYINLTKSGNTISVNSNISFSGTLVVADYDANGIMKNIVTYPVTGACTKSIPTTMTGTVKAFLVTDLDNIRPLCSSAGN